MDRLQIVRELHRNARTHFQRRKYTMYGIAESLQADLIEMQPYKRQNSGYRYILLVIDNFSKYAFAEPVKKKDAIQVCNAMERIIKKVKQQYPHHNIRNLQTDDGKEFFNSLMKRLLEKFNINHYSTFSSMKAAIVERLIRTIKHRLYVQFSMQGNYKWHRNLQEIISSYNNTR